MMDDQNKAGSSMPDEPMLQFFAYQHLPPNLQEISRPFGEMAMQIAQTMPRNPERTAGLRKLLEAKDCIVRADYALPGMSSVWLV